MYVLFVLHGFKLVVDTYQLFLLFKNGIFHISFFKALLINEGETTRSEKESGRTGIVAKRLTGRTGFGAKRPGFQTTVHK
jgi:hypothetical protein